MNQSRIPTNISRRKALAVLGGGAAAGLGVAGLSTASQSQSPLTKEQKETFYQRSKEQYGAEEAEIALRIVKEEYRRQEEEGLADQARFDAINQRLLDHPDNPKNTADLEEVLEALHVINDHDTTTNVDAGGGGGEVGSNANTCDCSGGGEEYVLSIDSAEEDHDDANGAYTKTKTNVDNDNQRAYVATGIHGAGHATTRLYGTVYISDDADYNITADYFRRVYCADAEAKISIIVRPSYGGWNAKPVETISAHKEGSVSKSKTYTLDGGYYHDIGVEVVAQGSTMSADGDTADVYHYKNGELRHLHVGELAIKQF